MEPDLNVLVADLRADHALHEAARAWLAGARQDCIRGSDTLRLLPMVLAGFLRLGTSPRVFVEPDSIEDALGFIDALLDTPGVRLGTCGDEWLLLRDKLLSLGLKANMVTDAWIASTVEACAEHLATFDRDFSKLLPARDLTLLSPTP